MYTNAYVVISLALTHNYLLSHSRFKQQAETIAESMREEKWQVYLTRFLQAGLELVEINQMPGDLMYVAAGTWYLNEVSLLSHVLVIFYFYFFNFSPCTYASHSHSHLLLTSVRQWETQENCHGCSPRAPPCSFAWLGMPTELTRRK